MDPAHRVLIVDDNAVRPCRSCSWPRRFAAPWWTRPPMGMVP